MNKGSSNSTPVSSPLASIDDIQKRLLRPSPAISSLGDVQGGDRSQQNVNLPLLQMQQDAKEKAATKKRLEDYLDPVLLSAISAEIGSEHKQMSEKKLKRQAEDFDWPVNELKVFMADSSRTIKRANLKKKKKKKNRFDLGQSLGFEENEDTDVFSIPFK